MKAETEDGVFYVPAETNDVIYSELSFNVDHISDKDYGYLGLLCDMVGKQDTEKFGFNELSTKIDMYTGGITASCASILWCGFKSKKSSQCKCKSSVSEC